jgi:arylformamidase
MEDMMNKILYDITVPIHSEMPVYEGDDPIITKALFTIDKEGVNITAIQNFTTHFGTHVDPPLHFVAQGKTLDDIPLGNFWGKASVIYIENQRAVTAQELMKHDIAADDIILLHTRNSGMLSLKTFQKDHVYIAGDAAEYLVSKKVRLVGIDYLSVDQFGDETYPAHNTFLKNGIIILESANLQYVPAGVYNLVCLPLRIKGADGAPARAVLTEYK